MPRDRRPLALLLLLLLLPACAGTGGDDPAEVARTTLTQVGQPAPPFTVPLLDGGVFDLEAQRGKVVLVNFFATWCPPCVAEMPHLQTAVWERFAGDGFAMISIARQESAEVVAPFVQKHDAGWPFGLDGDRSAYAKYADAFIPRSYVIDRTGAIVFQGSGFEQDEFDRMVAVIAAELAKPAP